MAVRLAIVAAAAVATLTLSAAFAAEPDRSPPQYAGTVLPLTAPTFLKPAAIDGAAKFVSTKATVDSSSGVARESLEMRGTLESYRRGDAIQHTIVLSQMGQIGDPKSFQPFVFSARYSLDGKLEDTWVHGRSISDARQKPTGKAAALVEALLGTFALIEASQPAENTPLHIRRMVEPIAQVARAQNPKTDFYIDGSGAVGRLIGRVMRGGREGYLVSYEGSERLRSNIYGMTIEARGYGIVDAATAIIVETDMVFLSVVQNHGNGSEIRTTERIATNIRF